MAVALKKLKKKKVVVVPALKKKITMFRPMIRSRHKTHNPLRTDLKLMPFKSVIRFGSSTQLLDTVAKGGKRVEINSVDAIHNSASKFRMKKCFEAAKVITARFLFGTYRPEFKNEGIQEPGHPESHLKFPVIAKLNFGSRGNGMHLIKTKEDWDRVYNAIRGRINDYLFEEYMNYSREYRLHVTALGCFYTCRKMLKNEAKERWFKNDSNCVWITDENQMFEKPGNWAEIVAECVKALKSVGLDFGACDVRVQSQKVGKAPKFFIVEINSAPSFGNLTLEKYKEMLPALLYAKKDNNYARA